MIIDTDVFVALLKEETAAKEAIQRLEENGERIETTVITAYELLRGANISSQKAKNLAEVQQLLSNAEILELTLKACEEASNIYTALREKGCLIGELDALIAGIARARGEAVLTRDDHFTIIQGIKAVKW